MNQLIPVEVSQSSPDMARRKLVKTIGLLPLFWLLNGCGGGKAGGRIELQTRPASPELSPEYLSWINDGRQLREQYASDSLRDTLNRNVFVGDLPLGGDPAVARLWQMTQTVGLTTQRQKLTRWLQRSAMAIGMLSFESSGRYNGGINACNIAGVDLVGLNVPPWLKNGRLLHPLAYVMKKIDSGVLLPSPVSDEEARRTIYPLEEHPEIQLWHSNMADSWLRSEMARWLGWTPVKSDIELPVSLERGHMVVGVTKHELIKSGKIRIGHMFGLLPGLDTNNQVVPVLSQATSNIEARLLDMSRPRENDPLDYDKCHPEDSETYNFYRIRFDHD